MLVELGVGLGYDVLLFLVGSQVHDLVTHPTIDHTAVRGLDEPVLVDPGVGGQRPDQADVRSLGRLDRAHAPVVRAVHVTHLETGALARESARTERRKAPLVGQARERVVLVHELAQLAGPEELFDGSDHRPDVDEGLGRDRLDILGGHAFAHDPFHPAQPHTHLVLDQLAHRPDAPVRKVVLVVDAIPCPAVRQVEHVRGGCQDLRWAQHTLVGSRTLEVDVEQLTDALDLRTELALELVTADPGQVVALRVEEGVLEVAARCLRRERLSRARPLVDLEQRLLTGRSEVSFMLPLTLEEVEVPYEAGQEAFVLVTERPQQDEQ